MSAKNILLNVGHLLLFLMFGTLMGFAVPFYFNDYSPFLDHSAMPGSPPIGIFIIPFLVLVFCIFAIIILSVLLFCMKKSVKISHLKFRKGEGKVVAAFRSIGYLTVLFLIYSAVQDWIVFGRFFLSGLWFYASHILFTLSGTAIFLSIITKKI